MSGAVTATIVAVGVSEATAAAIASIAVPMLTSAAIGAVGSAIMGGNPLTGALTGAIGGGFGAIGGLAGTAMGIGADAGGALFGAAGGALGAGITGGNPLTGALTGGAGGLFGQMAQNGDLSSLFDSGSVTPTTGIDPTTGLNMGVGPTQAAANALDPNSLGQLAAAASPSSGLLTPPSAGTGLDPFSSAGSSAANNAFVNGTAIPAASGALSAPSAPASAAAPSTSSWNSLGDNPITNFLIGSGSPSIPSGQTAQQAMDKMNSTGQAQIFTQGGQSYTLNTNGTATAIGKASSTGSSGGLLGALTKDPLQTLQVGLGAYNAANAPSLPTLQQQQAAVQGPGFSTNLPQYNATQTRNPIADYYTYGYSPQPTQISTTLTPTTGQGTGNAPIKLARGGFSRPHLPGAPHLLRAPRRNAGAGLAQLGAMSHARRAGALPAAPGAASPIGGALATPMAHGGMFARQGQVQQGTGTKGQADKVPALLSEDEFVMPADVVSSLGDGSSNAGGGVLKQFVDNVRAHKAKTGKDGMPPRAKAVEHYLRGA